MCVCVCVYERERERERVVFNTHILIQPHSFIHTPKNIRTRDFKS